MQNIDISKLIEVKLDFSFVQDALSVTIKDIYQKISKLQDSNVKIQQKTSSLEKQTNNLYQQLQKVKEAHGQAYKILEDKLNNIPTVRIYQNQNKIQKPLDIVEKTPKQVLDHIENRLQLNLNSRNGKEVDLNCSSSNTERVMQTFRVKQTRFGENKNQKDVIDQKVYSIYQMAIQRIQAEITELRKDFRSQMNQITNKSMKIIDGKLESQANQIQKIKNNNNNNNINTLQKIQLQNQIPSSKSHKAIISSHNIQKEPISSNKFNNNQSNEPNDNGQQISDKKSELCQFIAQLKKEVKIQLQEMVKNAQQKFQQISRTNSIIADHLVEVKKSMEEITNQKDSLKIQMASIRQKSSSSERQLCLMIDTTNQHKNKFKSLQNNIAKLQEQLKDIKINPDMIKQQRNQDDSSSIRSSKKQIPRDSQISFRSSIGNNLGPLRHNSMLKLNSGKSDLIQETIRNLNVRVSTLFDRVNKMEDDKKKYEMHTFGSSLPKIQKENKSNVNPIQLIKKQLKKVNEEIIKTNQKLTLTKDRLNQLYESHLQIPSKIEDLYIKLRQSNQLQQDRLIQLIKQLINRMLSDPFDNNFTNRLKREINVKFLQIKYEYNCILKQIESKVQNRAEIGQLNKVSQRFEENLLEVKAIANKKCESEDLKKGLKYLQGKIKQVFNFAKNQTVALANQQKQYIGAKKQSLH